MPRFALPLLVLPWLLASPVTLESGRALGFETQRIAVLAGGAGEPDADGGFLIQDLRDLGQALTARGWKVTAAAGPKDGLLPGAVRATNFNILRFTRTALRSADKGDEVLLVFHSHGLERESYWGQRSHSLVSEDRDPSGAEPGFDLDALDPDLEAARLRGARVGVVDLSCYSGATQRLRGPGCTLSLATPHYVSICSGRPEERTFSSRFIRIPGPGTPVSLESQFLAARLGDTESINLPQLSSRTTPAARQWDSLLRQMDPLDLKGNIGDFRTGAKAFDPGKLIQAVHRALAGSDLTPSARGALERRISREIRRLVVIRAKIEKSMPEMARTYDDETLRLELPDRDAFPISPGYLVDLLDKVSVTNFNPDRLDGCSQAERDLLSALRPERERVARTFRGAIRGFRERRRAYDALVNQLESGAGKLFASERQLYAHSSRERGPPDPCRDFAL